MFRLVLWKNKCVSNQGLLVFPHVFVRGSCFWFCIPSRPLRLLLLLLLLLPRVLRVESSQRCCMFVPAVHFVRRGGRESRTHVPSLRRKPPLNRTEGLPRNKRRGRTCKCQTVLDHGYDGKHSFLSAQKNGLRGPCGRRAGIRHENGACARRVTKYSCGARTTTNLVFTSGYNAWRFYFQIACALLPQYPGTDVHGSTRSARRGMPNGSNGTCAESAFVVD